MLKDPFLKVNIKDSKCSHTNLKIMKMVVVHHKSKLDICRREDVLQPSLLLHVQYSIKIL